MGGGRITASELADMQRRTGTAPARPNRFVASSGQVVDVELLIRRVAHSPDPKERFNAVHLLLQRRGKSEIERALRECEYEDIAMRSLVDRYTSLATYDEIAILATSAPLIGREIIRRTSEPWFLEKIRRVAQRENPEIAHAAAQKTLGLMSAGNQTARRTTEEGRIMAGPVEDATYRLKNERYAWAPSVDICIRRIRQEPDANFRLAQAAGETVNETVGKILLTHVKGDVENLWYAYRHAKIQCKDDVAAVAISLLEPFALDGTITKPEDIATILRETRVGHRELAREIIDKHNTDPDIIFAIACTVGSRGKLLFQPDIGMKEMEGMVGDLSDPEHLLLVMLHSRNQEHSRIAGDRLAGMIDSIGNPRALEDMARTHVDPEVCKKAVERLSSCCRGEDEWVSRLHRIAEHGRFGSVSDLCRQKIDTVR